MSNQNVVQTSNPSFFSQKMSSVEIAETMDKLHRHVMRDIRKLIEEKTIDESKIGLIFYTDSMSRKQPAYELDFESTMTLITGYDAKKRQLVIRRWMDLETGQAVPLSGLVSEEPVPRLLSQLFKQMHNLESKLDSFRPARSAVGPVLTFVQQECIHGFHYVTKKDDMYQAYVDWCHEHGHLLESRAHFFMKLYRTDKAYNSTMTVKGRRVPAVRGLAMKDRNQLSWSAVNMGGNA